MTPDVVRLTVDVDGRRRGPAVAAARRGGAARAGGRARRRLVVDLTRTARARAGLTLVGPPRPRLSRCEAARVRTPGGSGTHDGCRRRRRQHLARRGLRDPDGSLGPSWVRLPMMVLGAFVIDVVPRSLWRSRRRLRVVPAARPRASSTSTGPASGSRWWSSGWCRFYVTYVSYRNLKNFLPLVYGTQDLRPAAAPDRQVPDVRPRAGDRAAPACSARPRRARPGLVYLLFLPISPLSLIVYLVWSRNISYGYWYATAQSPGVGVRHRQLLRRCRRWARTSRSRSATVDLDHDRGHVAAELAVLGPLGRAPGPLPDQLHPERRRVRLAARRHHPDPGAGHPLHRAARLDALVDVGVLRAHRALHAVLRLALHRRRHGRRGASPGSRCGSAGQGDRAEVRAARPRLAPDDLHVEGAGARGRGAGSTGSRTVSDPA